MKQEARNASGMPVPEELQLYVKELVARVGEANASKQLEVSRPTIPRLVAGLPVRAGTLALVKISLEKSKEAKP